MNDLFELFWLAGMRKLNKKMARKSFERVMKQVADPEDFVQMLIKDIEYRISVGQFGFNQMHPTTYLNGERWEDDKSIPIMIHQKQVMAVSESCHASTKTKERSIQQGLEDTSWAN